MEHSNEIKAKVFAQYLGQSIKSNGKKYELTVLDPNNRHKKELFFALDNEVQLILKPLSSISDEDAIEVAKIQRPQFKVTAELGRSLVEKSIKGYHTLTIRSYQFLLSRGYDMPQYLLGNKTLHECNLCCYE